jgi:CubicO group peptidase (beta-lactamase class C family)
MTLCLARLARQHNLLRIVSAHRDNPATRRHTLIILLVQAWLWGTCLSAPGDELDDYLRAEMRARQIPGLSLAVVREGKTVKAQGYGLADLELNVPVGRESVFEIGSITKQFTAAAILLLSEEGKLHLEDKVSEHLPGCPQTWSNLTIRHLLTHTSGLKNYNGLAGFEVSRKLDATKFIATLGPEPLNFAPGESFSYCNSGYNLLGYVLEKKSGQSYWQFLSERIFKPLGMTSCQSRDLKTIMTNRVHGYEMEKGVLMNRDSDLTDVFAAGAIVSTALDLVKWNAALETDKLLSPSSRAEMWKPVRLNDGRTYPYGFGWRLDDYRGLKNIGHSGSTSGFCASLQRFPDQNVTVIVLCNLGEQGLATRLARGIAGFYLSSLREESQTAQPK